ncbi:MAG: metal ABC transporter permease [Deltaproteobacteria bacterium]|nr:metal ABC transporter permease [Deltaproteobacteria bacterium]
MGDAGLTPSMFFDAWELFRTPTLTGTVAAAMLGVLGVYVVLRRMVFLSAAISQAAGLGVALAYLGAVSFGLAGVWASPTLGAAVLTLGATALIAADRSATSARRDALIGVVYLVGSAGMLAVGTRIVQELQDIDALLFGSAVAVSDADFHLVSATACAVLAVHALGWRGFSAASFDPDGAQVRGLPVRALEATLFITLALAVSVSTRVLGALPTFAFSVLPSLAAVRLAPNLPVALLLGGLFGALSGGVGYLVAFLYEIPVGAAQTLVAAALVASAELAVRAARLLPRQGLSSSKR